MTETTMLLRAIGVHKDNLTVAVSSNPEEILPHDVRLVKYIIRDLMKVEDEMVKELTSREVLEY